ncbi:MAG: DUF5372 family protein, partial [Actinomycetota bacterium]|nr:DUF5372 family protein [Actinomycetota bacterium]
AHRPPPRPCRPPSTARAGSVPERFRITHPFHPLKGEEYELVGFAHTWGEHRVFFRKPGDQRVCSLPAGWTDVEAPDAFVVVAAGRSLFRPEDLLALADLVEGLRHTKRR